ncbi:hypothetical protein IIC65_02850, partial [Candidatus Sumerlaeota bacterium]|nr:hypothetical protein [Candidatus Sumerlaeota bacterium]
ADAVVASTDVINRAVVLARLPVPVYLDFNGHPMAEAQMLAKVFGSDDGLLNQWLMVLPSLLGGDRFSTCSTPQKAALLGELGAAGRLNHATADLDIVDVIHPAVAVSEPRGRPGAIRGKLMPEDGVAVLSTGGYNTWMDEQSLFKALEYAMAKDSRVHFVSIGGAIKGHNEKTFDLFKQRTASSSFTDHYHFCGWMPTEALGDYYLEADLAVNIDLACYEGLLGWRNRILEWAIAEVPIATTTLSELTVDLAERDLVAAMDCGDWKALGDHILALAADPQPARQRAAQCKRYVTEKYDYGRAVGPILEWLESLQPAPDLPLPPLRPNVEMPIAPDNSLARFWATVIRERSAIQSADQPAHGKGRSISAVVRRLMGK